MTDAVDMLTDKIITLQTALATVQALRDDALQQRDQAYATARADVLQEVREKVEKLDVFSYEDEDGDPYDMVSFDDLLRTIDALLGGDA